ncbi:MAG: UbiA family prenyltransferase [Candidatus Binatia bacterium]
MTWQTALRLGRVSNLPTVWTNVTAAAVLAGAAIPSLAWLVVAVACSLSYVGGMFLNDAFDRELDARLRPERPIPAGTVAPSAVFAAGFVLLGVGLLLVVVTARLTLDAGAGLAVASALALAGAIVLYDVWHKANPYAPLLMGVCRVLVYVTAAATLTGGVASGVLVGAIVVLAYLIGLTYVARQETLGRVENLWPLLFLALPFAYGVPTLMAGGIGSLVYLGFLGWVLFSLSHLGWRAETNVPRAVVSLIAGIALLDGLIMAGHGGAGTVVVAAGAFLLTLGLQRWVPGT